MKEAYQEERGNSVTHFIGVLFALSSIWMVGAAALLGWRWSMGVLFFIVGMFLMFLSSTIYHYLPPGRARDLMRRCDHISIYVMIACSYTPICIAVVGGMVGWTVFAIMWAVALYFYAHDSRRHYHTVWHIFVLLGALAHWGAILTIMLREIKA